jgi:hypothetical protein
MFSSTCSPYKPNTLKPRLRLLKYLNQPTLAVVMLVSSALLSSVGGKESRKPSLNGSATGGTVATGKDRTPCPGATPSVSVAASLRKAFNDPSRSITQINRG